MNIPIKTSRKAFINLVLDWQIMIKIVVKNAGIGLMAIISKAGFKIVQKRNENSKTRIRKNYCYGE